jgi:hypothetical protein
MVTGLTLAVQQRSGWAHAAAVFEWKGLQCWRTPGDGVGWVEVCLWAVHGDSADAGVQQHW